MPRPTTPIDRLITAPYENVEGYVQQVLEDWQAQYFKDGVFTTEDELGVEVQKDFLKVERLYNQDRLPQPMKGSVFHWQLADNRDREENFRGQRHWVSAMVWNVYVKTGSQVESGDAGNENRRSAGELKWLLQSKERQRLVEAGLGRMNIDRGPVVVASTPLLIRQLIVSMEVYTSFHPVVS